MTKDGTKQTGMETLHLGLENMLSEWGEQGYTPEMLKADLDRASRTFESLNRTVQIAVPNAESITQRLEAVEKRLAELAEREERRERGKRWYDGIMYVFHWVFFIALLLLCLHDSHVQVERFKEMKKIEASVKEAKDGSSTVHRHR